MKIGMYSVTYRGVWYRGEAIDIFTLVRLAKQQGWEGLELDTERPHAAPMDLSKDDRKRLRDLAATVGMDLCAVSPNCDLSSPVPSQREAMICYVRECIKLARDLGSPICKVFAAWRGITLHDGFGTYDETYGYNQYGFWKEDRRKFVVQSMRELCKIAEDNGIVLAMQNHGPDVVNTYQEVLELIEEAGLPAFKACMDINIEPHADSPEHARKMAAATGSLQVHSHANGEFVRRQNGSVELVAGDTSTNTSGQAGRVPSLCRGVGGFGLRRLHELGVLSSCMSERGTCRCRIRTSADPNGVGVLIGFARCGRRAHRQSKCLVAFGSIASSTISGQVVLRC